MHKIAQQLYGLKNPTTPTVFEALMDSIVEQQISLKVAQSIEVRLIKEFGETLTLDAEIYYIYPTPQTIAKVKVSELKICGLSEQKAQYLQGAAQLIVQGKLDLEKLKTKQSTAEILFDLDAIRALGFGQLN